MQGRKVRVDGVGTPTPVLPSLIKIRVNYYIEDIYGNPDKSKDPWTSPLARLVALGSLLRLIQ